MYPYVEQTSITDRHEELHNQCKCLYSSPQTCNNIEFRRIGPSTWSSAENISLQDPSLPLEWLYDSTISFISSGVVKTTYFLQNEICALFIVKNYPRTLIKLTNVENILRFPELHLIFEPKPFSGVGRKTRGATLLIICCSHNFILLLLSFCSAHEALRAEQGSTLLGTAEIGSSESCRA
jgi:hypothetical protein